MPQTFKNKNRQATSNLKRVIKSLVEYIWEYDEVVLNKKITQQESKAIAANIVSNLIGEIDDRMILEQIEIIRQEEAMSRLAQAVASSRGRNTRL